MFRMQLALVIVLAIAALSNAFTTTNFINKLKIEWFKQTTSKYWECDNSKPYDYEVISSLEPTNCITSNEFCFDTLVREKHYLKCDYKIKIAFDKNTYESTFKTETYRELIHEETYVKPGMFTQAGDLTYNVANKAYNIANNAINNVAEYFDLL